MAKKTIRTYVGNGVTTIYPIDFTLGFINRDYVYVYLTVNDYTVQVPYTWLNDSQIELNSPMSNGYEFNIRRILPRDTLINDYVDGAILREEDLDNSFRQTLMIQEELEDGFFSVSTAAILMTSDIDMQGNQILGLPEPVNDNDVVRLQDLVAFEKIDNTEILAALAVQEELRLVLEGVRVYSFDAARALTGSAFYMRDTNGDLGTRLVEGYDYTLRADIDEYTLELTRTWNTGNIIQRVYNDIAATTRAYVHNIATLAYAVADVSISVGDSINLAERTAGNGGGAMWDVVLASGVTANTFDIVACTGVPTLALVLRNSTRTLTASIMGFATETLFADTQTYKSISYSVNRYTQNYDTLGFFNWFVSQDRFDTFDFEDKKLYLSFTVLGDWSGKHLVGSGGKNCGFIHGQINWADGTKSTSITKVGFYGKIAYLSLPLPVTIDPLLQFTAGWFWRDDSIDFGFGYGALGALTASSDGNTNDIIIDDCYFEMRDAVISGGSAPSDEDRPKVHNVTFRNNETKGVMNHGFASIHFRYSKVYGNHFYEHYSGYCCDFSLGSQDSIFFSNTGDRLAAGVKSEPRSFNGSFRNKFYDNKLILRWRWENTGASFNTVFRTKGAEVELYDNTFTMYDYTPELAEIALNIEGLSTVIDNNKFYIKGTPVGFTWFAQIKNGIDVPTAGQRLSFTRNKIFNETLVSISSGLQITSVASDTWSIIEHSGNEYTGLWGGMINPEFGSALSVIDKLVFNDNTFPNTQLFKAESAFTVNNIEAVDNKYTCVTDNVSIDLGNINCDGLINIVDNKGDYRATSGAGFVSKSNPTGDISSANLTVKGNILTNLDGILCYLLAGGDVPIDTVDILGNSVIWDSTSVFTNVVYTKGATTFTMHGNTLINRRATSCFISRPAIAGGNSLFDFNPQVGSFTDNP